MTFQARNLSKFGATWLTGCLVWLAIAATAFAQHSTMQPRYSGVMIPGAIGAARVRHDHTVPGYFQPVEIKVPSGAEISLAVEGQFDEPQATPVLAGFLIGPVYRLKVTGIPYHPGEEIFPTIEVIHRLYPPAGQARRFPIVVEMTQEDLELALRGNFVTRVIYLENPSEALPTAQTEEQINYDTRPGEDPLATADTLGRPVAILRLGGRQPLVDPSGQIDLRADCAPLLKFSAKAANPAAFVEPARLAPEALPYIPGEMPE